MSTQPATRSRWMDWNAKAAILAETAEGEPTKPSKPGFVGFEGATSAESREIEAGSDAAESARASAALNRAGIRIMELGGVTTIGVWSDLDGPDIREALAALNMGTLPIRYLDGAGIPFRYKLRRVAGEPVPATVLAAMERAAAEPWISRDRLLDEMGWRSKSIPKSCGG